MVTAGIQVSAFVGLGILHGGKALPEAAGTRRPPNMDERASPLRVLHRQLLYRRARFAMQIQACEKALCKIPLP
ncbi:hypothetical protein SRHO_G00055730 [Serrasalmus rhombeus]